MSLITSAAIVFTLITIGAATFQIALAFGAPWGAYAMGGIHPGKLPPVLRIAALFQAGLLIGFGLVVLMRAGLILLTWLPAAQWVIWVVVGFSSLSLVLNLITPSANERAIWAPVALGMLACSLIVALARN